MQYISKKLPNLFWSAAIWAALFTASLFTLVSLLAAFPDYHTSASGFMTSIGKTLLYPGNYVAAGTFARLFRVPWMADQAGQYVTLFITLFVNWIFYFGLFSLFVWVRRGQER